MLPATSGCNIDGFDGAELHLNNSASVGVMRTKRVMRSSQLSQLYSTTRYVEGEGEDCIIDQARWTTCPAAICTAVHKRV